MNTLPLMLTVSLFSAGLVTLNTHKKNGYPAAFRPVALTTVDSGPAIKRQTAPAALRPLAPTFKGDKAKQDRAAPQIKPPAKTLPQAAKTQHP